MAAPLPLTLVTGPLGSGKTTLLLHFLEASHERLAIVMNEFGELSIDAEIVRGKNVDMVELAGGCVCCSLLGEFEAALEEILERAQPERIVVETTGLAEPDALLVDVEESSSAVRVDGVVTVVDADAMERYPRMGRTARMQIEAADLLVLNKVDLVPEEVREREKAELAHLNDAAPVVFAVRCRVDPALLFGLGRERTISAPRHVHQPEFQSVEYRTEELLERGRFERLAQRLDEWAYRAKGFVRFPEGVHLFHFVAGRWSLEPFDAERPERTELVFIGEGLSRNRESLLAALGRCHAFRTRE